VGSKGTSTSKDYLLTFVRVNFADFHLRGPIVSTAPRKNNGRESDVARARNEMKPNILTKGS
jgi:hypothetical protein